MKQLLFSFFFIIVFNQVAAAYEASISVYTFENRGNSTSTKIRLEDRTTPLPVKFAWFEWNCSAQKQVDGVSLQCRRGDEIAETKMYCYDFSQREDRYIKMQKGDNFVSFSCRCRPTKGEMRRMAWARKRHFKRKKNMPEGERIPVPAQFKNKSNELQVIVPGQKGPQQSAAPKNSVQPPAPPSAQAPVQLPGEPPPPENFIPPPEPSEAAAPPAEPPPAKQ